MRYYLIELYRTSNNKPVYATSECSRAPTLRTKYAARFTSDIAANRHKDASRSKDYPEPKVVVVEVDDGIVDDEKDLEAKVIARWER